MKTFITGALIIGLLVVGGYCDSHYTRKDCVVIQHCDGIATIRDTQGWTWDVMDSDLKVGDIVDAKMYTNRTNDTIEDDEVIDVVLK